MVKLRHRILDALLKDVCSKRGGKTPAKADSALSPLVGSILGLCHDRAEGRASGGDGTVGVLDVCFGVRIRRIGRDGGWAQCEHEYGR